jgi:hypothetical protein
MIIYKYKFCTLSQLASYRLRTANRRKAQVRASCNTASCLDILDN